MKNTTFRGLTLAAIVLAAWVSSATATDCPATPAGGCLAPAKTSLSLKKSGDPTKSKLIWKWLKGPALVQSDFGNPTMGGNGYNLCVYAGTGAAELDIERPGTGDWSAISTKGYKFRDPIIGAIDGIIKILEKGGDPGKSKIIVKGKGADLDLSALPLNVGSQLIVQYLRSDDPTCWQSVFPVSAIDSDTATQFKAKLP